MRFLNLNSFKGTLKPLAPFDFSQSLAFLSNFSPTKNEQEVEQASLTKAVEIKGKTIAFEVSDAGSVENPKLQFTAYSEADFTEEIEKLLSDRISFFLSLQDDLKGFYEITKSDQCFKPVIKRFYGHKQVKFLTPFEIACWAVLNQRIPMVVAHKMKERIIQKIGSSIKVKGVDFWAFPEASKLAAVDATSMVELVHNTRKAEYVSAVSNAFSKVDEQWLRTAAYDEVHEWLTDIRGIGVWSANFIMLRGLGRMEQLSNVDPELALDAGKIYAGKDEPLTDEEVCRIADKYGNWRGYWAYYLRIYAEFVYVFEKGKKRLIQ